MAVQTEQFVFVCSQGKVLGEFTRDKFHGEFMEAWRSAVGKAEFEKVCIFTDLIRKLLFETFPAIIGHFTTVLSDLSC